MSADAARGVFTSNILKSQIVGADIHVSA